MLISTDHQEYIQFNETSCYGPYNDFSTLDEAKAACSLDTKCHGVKNKNCNGTKFELCQRQGSFQLNNDSCTHIKGAGQVYTEVDYVSCLGRYLLYYNLGEAKTACSSLDQCLGVYNKKCEGKIFQLCPWAFKESVSDCTFRKPGNQTTNPSTTTAKPTIPNTTTADPGPTSSAGGCQDALPNNQCAMLFQKSQTICDLHFFKFKLCKHTCGQCNEAQSRKVPM